jgi:hypothetical protein
MTTHPGREQNWYPISKLGWFTGHIREGITVPRRQLELLQPAQSQPYLLDNATVARIIGVHRDQAGAAQLLPLLLPAAGPPLARSGQGGSSGTYL